MIANGESATIAEMLATRTVPSVQTETRWLAGRNGNGFFSRQLGCWVESRAHVKKIAAERGLDVYGSVNHTCTKDQPDPLSAPYEVADGLVDDYCRDILDEHPTALRDDPDLRQKVKESLSPKYDD